MSDPATFTEMVQNLSESRRGTSHPGPELLLAYYERDLDDGKRASVQGHLAACSQCADFVLEMSRADREGARLDDPEVEAALFSVHETLGLEPAKTAAVSWTTPVWIAAALALVAFALGIVAWRQQVLLGAQSRKLALIAENGVADGGIAGHSFEIVSLEPSSTALRGPSITLSERSVLLVLNHLASRPDGTYSAELRDDDKPIWEWTRMKPTSMGNFTVRVPESLEPGKTYDLQLFLEGDGKKIPEAAFRFSTGD